MPRSRSRDRKHRKRSPSRSRSRGRRGRRSRTPSVSRSRTPSSSRSPPRKREKKRSSRSDSRSRSRSRSPSSSRSRSRSRSPSPRKRKESKAEKKRRKEEKRRAREEKRRAKKAAKAKETLAEKQARRLAKKQGKLGKVTEVFGYTNDDNPFGDSNLSTQFKWHKKIEKEIETGKIRKAPSKNEQQAKQQALLDEIQRVRDRREQYEKEREEREQQRIEEQRAKEAEMYGDWERKEEEFHRVQSKRRSALRILDGREKPIDILAKNILLLQSGADDGTLSSVISGDNVVDQAAMDVELEVPYQVFEGLPSSELETLLDEIRTYLDMSAYSDYWQSLAALCRAELEAAREEERKGSKEGRRRVAEAVESDIKKMFTGKSPTELDDMRPDIQRRIDRAGRRADADYWHHVMDELELFRARARLNELHLEILEASLKKLEERRVIVKARLEAQGVHVGAGAGAGAGTGDGADGAMDSDDEGALSPALLSDSDEDDDEGDEDKKGAAAAAAAAAAADSDSDDDDLAAKRAAHIAARGDKPVPSAPSAADRMYEAEKARGMGEGEEMFGGGGDDLADGDDFAAARGKDTLDDRFRPRKPRYFNRVKTGYDWNKYNQTHYDYDNPPPKTIQGYKFNVFYPDLLDVSVTPTYFLEPCPAAPDFAILRFHAGPPYEDVAFKVLNKEWEMSRKHGFRCSFDRGILQLHFNLKRSRYRR